MNNKQRQQVSIPIVGLDTSSPDEVAQNGTCRELLNLRYVDNAWHGVGPLTSIAEIPIGSIIDTSGSAPQIYTAHVQIIYKHPASPANKYIAFVRYYALYSDDACEIEGYAEIDIEALPSGFSATDTRAICVDAYQRKTLLGGLNKDITYIFSHFGNVLIAQGGGQLHYFIYDKLKDKYSAYITPNTPSVSIGAIDRTNVKLPYNDLTAIIKDNNRPCWKLMNKDTGVITYPTNDGTDNFWWGELVFIVAYRSADGGCFCPTKPQLLCSEPYDGAVAYTLASVYDSENEQNYLCYVNESVSVQGGAQSVTSSYLRRILPKVTIHIPENIPDTLTKVAIYATRINTIVDYEKLLAEAKTFAAVNNKPRSKFLASYYADNALLEQPLYLVEEIELANIQDNVWEVELGYDKLKDLTSQIEVYSPLNPHQVYAEVLYEYNNRLHLANLTSTLFSPTTNLASVMTGGAHEGDSVKEFVQLNNGCSVYSANSIAPIKDESLTTDAISRAVLQWHNPVVSYPDYRAESILVIGTKFNNIRYHRVSLRSAPANNLAYYIAPPTIYGKYSTKQEPDTTTLSSLTGSRPTENKTLMESNRLQVSKANNCFVLPFDTSYNIGNETTSILAIAATAEMMADSRFGQTPLYVFTSDGIWALVQGEGEVLYSNWAFINPDRIINPSTAAANGVLFYITARGIHAISGRQSRLISTSINTIDGVPLDLANATMFLQHLYNELIVSPRYTAWAYVYNIEQGYWSTRNAPGRLVAQGITTTDNSSPYYADKVYIYDCEHEENRTVHAKLTTRPIKLQRGAITRIESLITRLAGIGSVTIKIDGSNNLTDWTTLRNVTFSPADRDVHIRHLPASAVYHTITISANITPVKYLSLFDIVFYTKYLAKLR